MQKEVKMFELMSSEYKNVRNILHESEIECVYAFSVLEGKQKGKVYVDSQNNPKSCLILNDGGIYFLGGDEENKDFLDSLTLYLKDTSHHSIYFDLYTASDKWIEIMKQALDGNVVKLGRSLYHYTNSNKHIISSETNILPEGFELKSFTAELFNKYANEMDHSYKNLWTSAENFLENGFGFCILYNNEFISVCNTFYVTSEYATLDIWTSDKYRNQGFATIVASAYIAKCLEQGLTPIWDADAGNDKSNKLAVKLGFKNLKDLNILWWHEDNSIIEKYLKMYNYISD